jgi:hypothetical protein
MQEKEETSVPVRCSGALFQTVVKRLVRMTIEVEQEMVMVAYLVKQPI